MPINATFGSVFLFFPFEGGAAARPILSRNIVAVAGSPVFCSHPRSSGYAFGCAATIGQNSGPT